MERFPFGLEEHSALVVLIDDFAGGGEQLQGFGVSGFGDDPARDFVVEPADFGFGVVFGLESEADDVELEFSDGGEDCLSDGGIGSLEDLDGAFFEEL